jgi:hypothetical protein
MESCRAEMVELGNGREGGELGLEDYLEIKAVMSPATA